MRLRVIDWIALLFAAPLLGGCAYQAEMPYATLTDVPLLWELQQRIGLRETPFQLEDPHNHVLSAAAFEPSLHWGDGKSMALASSGDLIRLPIAPRLRDAKAELRLTSRRPFSVVAGPGDFSISAIRARHDSTRGLTLVWPAEMLQIEGEGFRVYYEEGGEDAARALYHQMSSLHRTMQEILGLEPTPFAVALLKIPANYLTPDDPQGAPVFAFPEDYDLSIERHPIVTAAHEWTEHTLRHRLEDGDRDLRFAFDGLAEFVAAMNAGDRFRVSPRSLETLVQAEVEHVDVTRQFRMMLGTDQMFFSDHIQSAQSQAGYELSHLFWRRIAETYGDAAITDIIRRWRARGPLQADGLVQIVIEVTGDPSLRETLAQASPRDGLDECRRRGWMLPTLNEHIYMHVPFRRYPTHNGR